MKNSIIQVATGGIGNALHFIPLLKALHKADWKVDIWITKESLWPVCEIFNYLPGVTALCGSTENIPSPYLYDKLLLSSRPENRSFFQGLYPEIEKKILWYDYYPDILGCYLTESEYKFSLFRNELPDVLMPDNHITTSLMDENTLGVFAGYADGRDLKAWPYFTELCKRVRNVMVFGLPLDIKKGHWPEHVGFFSGSLREIVEKIRHLKVFVGNCAGITNLASVTGIPTIIIYGPTCKIKNRPEGANVIQVYSNDVQCRPCQRKDRKTYLSENCDTRTCLYSIKPDQVVQIIEKYIQVSD